jgi:hypothetical protein
MDTATLTNAYAIRMFDEAMKSRVRVEQGLKAPTSSTTGRSLDTFRKYYDAAHARPDPLGFQSEEDGSAGGCTLPPYF